MKKILLSAMISTVLAGGALAGAPSSTFHGFYAGGGLTYSKGDLAVKVDNSNSSPTFSSSGAGANIFLGYGNVVYGGLYLGGELSLGYDGSRFRDKIYTSTEPDGTKIELRLKSKSQLAYNIGGRVGYVFSNFLAYGKIGFEGRSEASILSKNSGNTITNVGRNGFLLGGGADYAITQNIFLRAEYTYNFGGQKKHSERGNTFTFRTKTKTILIGAGYKF